MRHVLRVLVGEFLVVGVVQKTGDGPDVGIGVRPAVARGRSPHHVLDGEHVPQEVGRLHPFVQLGEGFGTVEHISRRPSS